MGQLNHEPSMEDILASIKRIIAEDSEAVGARTPRARREAMAAVAASPVLRPVEHVAAEAAPERIELPPIEAPLDLGVHDVAAHNDAAPLGEATEAETPEPVAEAADADVVAAEEPEPSSELPDILELTSPMPEADTIPTAAPTKRASARTGTTTPGAEGLVSSPAAEASRNAFAALGQMQVRAEEGAPNTLDGLVADLLRPMLREWLDRELPTMVERLVSAEVARLSGRG